MYIFTIPREKFDERAPDKRIIRQLISKHISLVGDLKKNMAYYQGKELSAHASLVPFYNH